MNPQKPSFDSKYFDQSQFETDFRFPKDLKKYDIEVNNIDSLILLQYYLNEWTQWVNSAGNLTR